MTALPSNRPNTGLRCMVAVVALGVLALASVQVPDVGTVELRAHAVERHGADAQRARDAAVGGSPHGNWDCPDKDKVYVVHAQGPEWLVMVIGRTSHREVTSFATDDTDYLLRRLEQDGCRRTWQGGHP